ncbi:3-dehydroquinate synthase [Acidimicrobiaceae bacterium]|nr:3-dehydroquinate synthase [Acidimicrobiaceae bacterium]
MKLSEIHYSNKFDDLDSQLKNFINQEKHVIFIDSKLSSIINLDPKFKIFELEINESTKDLNTIQKIWKIMFSESLDRSSKIIGIGGGVLSDLVGFATSTFKRGANLSLVPSTFLGMVDAAHGGKTGFNNEFGKNQIGTFFIPEKIFICTEFLDSLSEIEMNNGIIESLKAGFLGDKEIIEMIYQYKLNNLEEIIKKSIQVKYNILKNDLRESNERMFLNLGHTIGHLIEKDSNYSISHGQAVAIGMLKGFEISESKFNLNSSIKDEFESFLNKQSMKTEYSFNSNQSELKEIITNDKKVTSDVVKFVLIKNIQEPVLIDFSINDLLEVLTNA